jgi:ABC-type sugar transport system substrate-binding protein
VRADLATAAAKRPQLDLAVRSANDSDAEQAKAVSELAAQGYRAIVVFGGASSELASACKAAIAKGITLLALHTELASDAYTYAVRTSDLELGKAAGLAARRLLPRGGTIVELQTRSTSRAAEQTHQGFLQGIGLAEAK